MTSFALRVDASEEMQAARLSLRNVRDRTLAEHEVALSRHSPAMWEGLFDTQNYVGRYAGNVILGRGKRAATGEQLLARLGVFLAEHVLGRSIWRYLEQPSSRRVDPAAAAAGTRSAGSGVRPRPLGTRSASRKSASLLERNVALRLEGADAAVRARPWRPRRHCRVLLVFAEEPGSNPLALRREREALLELFREQLSRSRAWRWTC